MILSSLSEEDSDALKPWLSRVDIPRGQLLPGERVFFIENGLISVRHRSGAETMMLGREGIAGHPRIVGEEGFHGVAMVRTTAMAMPVHALGQALRALKTLRSAIADFEARALLHAHLGTAAAVSLSSKQRIARWLIMCDERLGQDLLSVTHQELSTLMNLRRATVTEALKALEREGYVRAERGTIRICCRGKLASLTHGFRPGARIASGCAGTP